MRTINQLNLRGRRILLRADLNVPLENGLITDDFRLESIVPTLQKLRELRVEKIVLTTHIGRPTERTAALSTANLIPWFEKRGFPIVFAEDVSTAIEASMQPGNAIVLLENLRFFPGETKEPHRQEFAEELAQLGDCYINDAFGTLHRDQTSLTTLPRMFPPDQRGIGLLVEREITELTKLKSAVKQPFVLVIGGNKVASKLPMLMAFLTAPSDLRPQTILVGGRVAHAFLDAQNQAKPFASASSDIMHATEVLRFATQQQVSIALPTDQVTAIIDGSSAAIDIGMNTVQKFSEIIASANTVFLCGTVGMYEHPEGTFGTDKICHAIAQSPAAVKIVGGGDTMAAVHRYHIAEQFTLVSTGGTALLAFLSSPHPENDLPALAALKE